MNKNLVTKVAGVLLIASTLVATQVYAKCSEAFNQMNVQVNRCANVNGCGPNTMLKALEVSDSCPTWCCYNSTVPIYSGDCIFHNMHNSAGDLFCCSRGSSFGQ